MDNPNFEKDGRIAWLVCCSAILSNAMIIGIDAGFGEIIGSIMKDFDEAEGRVAWIGSIHSSLSYVGAFAGSLLVKRYGFGLVTFVGGLVGTLSFATAYFCPNVECLVSTYGILSGAGLGLAFFSANIVCSFYFEERRIIALTLVSSGAGIGIACNSFLLKIVNSSYGWKGSMLFCTASIPSTWLLALLLLKFPSHDGQGEASQHEVNILYIYTLTYVHL